MLRLKVRPLFFLLMARGTQAAALKLPKYTLPPTVTPPSLDVMAEWIKHVSHVPSLLPAEILILFGIIFAILFKIGCMIYKARKKETARTRLILEIGNESDCIVLPAMDLPYLAKHYCIRVTRTQLAFHLVESKSGTNFSWTSGVHLTNTVLDMSVPIPPKIYVPFWKVPKLRSLLQIPHFAVIRTLTEANNCSLQAATSPTAPLYPALSLASAPPM